MHFSENFRATRWIRTFNLVLQAVLFTTFCFGLNYLALHYAWRHDLTQSRRFSLSAETLAYLKDLKRPVTVVVTITEDADAAIFNDVRGLLREYVYATEANESRGRISVEYVDVYQNRSAADKYGLDKPNAVLFLSADGQQRTVVTTGELYRVVHHQDGTDEKMDFRGEQKFTAAILDVSATERKMIYFLVGHGEYQIDSVDPVTGLSGLATELRLRNFALAPLDINAKRRVPEDAALIIAVAPQGVEPFVQEQLRQYLSTRAGRVILLLAQGTKPELENLLWDWGVWVDDDRIYEPNPADFTEDGDLKIHSFAEGNPIVQTLGERQIPLIIGATRSLRPDPGRALGSGLTVTTLARTSPNAWGMRNYRRPRSAIFDPSIDIKGLPQMDPQNCLGVAVASERVQSRGNLPFSVRGGRLVVFGMADLVTNRRLQGAPGNYNLFLNAINWTVDRDTQLAIQPRPIEKFQLTLSQQELLRLRYCLLLLVPGAAAVLGIMVYWTRRS